MTASDLWSHRKFRAREFAKLVAGDTRAGSRYLLKNKVGGARLLPQPVRTYVYRALGMAVATWRIESGCTFVGVAKVDIGLGTCINHDCYFEAVAPITIGANCAIAMQVMFATSAHPFDASGHFATTAVGLPITVGDNCWIGARVTVLPGVTIGDDVVVAAGAVVTKDCDPGGLYAGVPARRIRDIA